jgi:hypothetical protein
MVFALYKFCAGLYSYSATDDWEIKIAALGGWALLLLVSAACVMVLNIIKSIGLAHAFGQGTAFGIGLAFLTVIFLCILAFGSAQYRPGVQNNTGDYNYNPENSGVNLDKNGDENNPFWY